MNFEFAGQINPYLAELNFDQAINIAETELRNLPTTVFHSVVGKPLTNQADGLANWTNKFYQQASKHIDIKALYFELNEFDINTDSWYIDGFSYDKDGGLNLDDMDWLSDFTRDRMTSEEFILTGFEKLQFAFESLELDDDDLQYARDWSEQIIIARFM